MKSLVLLATFISVANAAFDYRLFHPTLRGVYDLTRTSKPLKFAVDVTSNTLYHNTNNTLDWYYNGTKFIGEHGLGKLKSFQNGVFYTVVVGESDDPNNYLGYGYFSNDEEINLYAGGTPGLFMDVIRDKYHSRTMPVVDYPSFRGIPTPTGEERWSVDEGFESYDEVPHISGFNRFEDTIDHGVVNSRALCAMTNENKYVCTGDASFRQVWRSVAHNYLDTTSSGDFQVCATDTEVYILANGTVTWVSNQTLPAPFNSGNIESIRCSSSHLVAKVVTNIHTVDKDLNTRALSKVIDSDVNRMQIFYSTTDDVCCINSDGDWAVDVYEAVNMPCGICGIPGDPSPNPAPKYDPASSIISHHVIDFVNADYTFQVGPENIVKTDFSFAVLNETSLEIAHSIAEQKAILVRNVRDHYSCADGLHIYLDNDELKWKVYSHGDVSDLQTLLDERLLLDFVTTDEIGCMLVKLTDSHTGRNHTGLDYGTQADNNDDYDFAVYEDQTSDVILLSVSSVSLTMIITSMIYYFVRIRN